MGRREVRDLIQQLRSEGKTVFFSTHILSDAEALCDASVSFTRGNYAVSGRGGIDLRKARQGRDCLYAPEQKVPLALTGLGAEARISGDMVNAVLPEAQQEAALDVLRRERIKLISLTPVRSSLEEYYIQNCAEPRRDRSGTGRSGSQGAGA